MSALLLETGDGLLLEAGGHLLLDRAIELSASAHISAAAADPTTAQLTPPSGKTTSDFLAGVISDDTNPLPSINLGADEYTELEWALVATDGAEPGATYEFRVTRAGVPLDTYAVTPTWTVAGDVVAAGTFPRGLARGLWRGMRMAP